MKPKIETEVVQYTRDKKIADLNSLVLHSDSEVETPPPTKQVSPPQAPTEKFCWHKDQDCIAVHHQPAIAVHTDPKDGSVVIRQEDFFGEADHIVYFQPEFAEKVVQAILVLTRGASNRGGRRRGAGCPVGSKNQRSAEIAPAAAEEGITPIEVMLGTMRELWALGTREAKREAAEIAKDAAPYIHPRLASIDQAIREDRPFAVLVEPCSNAQEWEARYGRQAALEDRSSG